MSEPIVESAGHQEASAAGPDASAGASPEASSEVAPEPSESVRPALDRLADLDALPTHEHVEVYDDVHRRLHGALSDLDAARG